MSGRKAPWDFLCWNVRAFHPDWWWLTPLALSLHERTAPINDRTSSLATVRKTNIIYHIEARRADINTDDVCDGMSTFKATLYPPLTPPWEFPTHPPTQWSGCTWSRDSAALVDMLYWRPNSPWVMASLVFRKSSLVHTSKLGLRRIESGKWRGGKRHQRHTGRGERRWC